jgi:hypothetical protein
VASLKGISHSEKPDEPPLLFFQPVNPKHLNCPGLHLTQLGLNTRHKRAKRHRTPEIGDRGLKIEGRSYLVRHYPLSIQCIGDLSSGHVETVNREYQRQPSGDGQWQLVGSKEVSQAQSEDEKFDSDVHEHHRHQLGGCDRGPLTSVLGHDRRAGKEQSPDE